MAIAVECIEKGIAGTVKFYSGPGLAKKIASFALLVFMFSLFTGDSLGGFGGNMNYSTNDLSEFRSLLGADAETMIPKGDVIQNPEEKISASKEEGIGDFEDAIAPLTGMAVMPEAIDWQGISGIIFTAIIVLFVVFFILRIIGNAAFFAMIESAEKNRVDLSLVRKRLGKGLDLAILETILGLLSLPFILMFAVSVLSVFLGALAGIKPDVFAGAMDVLPVMGDAGLMAAFAIIGFAGLLVFAAANYFLKQFGVYLMHKKKLKAFASLKQGAGLGLGKLKELGILLAIQLGLGILIGVFATLASLAVVIPTAVVMVLLILGGLASGGNIIVIALLGLIGICIFLAAVYGGAVLVSPAYIFIINYNLNVLAGFLKK